MNVETQARDAVRNPGMDYGGDLPLFKTWGLSPYSTHAKADDLQESTFRRISAELEAQFPGDFKVESFDHYTLGWMDLLLVRVYDDEGNVTPAFLAALDKADDWNASLEEGAVSDMSRDRESPAAEYVDDEDDEEYEDDEEGLEEEFDEDRTVVEELPSMPAGDHVVLEEAIHESSPYTEVVRQVLRSAGGVKLTDPYERRNLSMSMSEALWHQGYRVPPNYLGFLLDDFRIREENLSDPAGREFVAGFLLKEIGPYVESEVA
jgi:hypothetical protein